LVAVTVPLPRVPQYTVFITAPYLGHPFTDLFFVTVGHLVFLLWAS